MEKSLDIRLRALSHPHRLRILGMVTAHPVSAVEVATATGLAHAAASYHLRQLAAAGLIRVTSVRERQRGRGRPRRRYQMRVSAFRAMGRRGARLLDRALLSELDRRLREAQTKRTITDAEVWLAPDEWRRLRELLRRVSTILHTRGEPPNTPASRHASVTTLLIEHQK